LSHLCNTQEITKELIALSEHPSAYSGDSRRSSDTNILMPSDLELILQATNTLPTAFIATLYFDVGSTLFYTD
jgi:hypothetical protein